MPTVGEPPRSGRQRGSGHGGGGNGGGGNGRGRRHRLHRGLADWRSSGRRCSRRHPGPCAAITLGLSAPGSARPPRASPFDDSLDTLTVLTARAEGSDCARHSFMHSVDVTDGTGCGDLT